MTGFSDGLDVAYKRRGVRNDFQGLACNTGRMERPFAEPVKGYSYLKHQVCIPSSVYSRYTHEAREGRKLPLAPGMGPPTSASSVEAMEKHEKEQKRRANIYLVVSE